MKRLTLVPIVAGVLALFAGSAFAKTEQWSGSLKAPDCGTYGNCALTFKVKVNDGNATQVKNFFDPNPPWDCNGQPGLDFNLNVAEMDVHHGKFSYKTGSDPQNMLKITGEFDKHLKTATGTVHVTHDDQLAGQCDSGVMTFKAKPEK
jgi:hypothetical protein